MREELSSHSIVAGLREWSLELWGEEQYMKGTYLRGTSIWKKRKLRAGEITRSMNPWIQPYLKSLDFYYKNQWIPFFSLSQFKLV